MRTCALPECENPLRPKRRQSAYCSRDHQVKGYRLGLRPDVTEGVRPDHPKVYLTVPGEMHAQIVAAAERAGMTVPGWLRELIADTLDLESVAS